MKKRWFVALLAVIISLLCVLCFTACEDNDTSGKSVPDTEENSGGDDKTPDGGDETPEQTCTHSWNSNNVCIHCGTVLKYTTSLLYELNEDGVSYKVIGKSDEVLENIIIPPYHDSLPVTTIGEHAFGDLGNEIAFTDGWGFVSVTIPHTVISIEPFAFNEFWGLGTVYFSEGSQLTSIGDSAFEATGLSSLVLPNSLITIGRNAFSGCNILANITVSKNVVSIGKDAFRNCWKLIEIENLFSLNITAGSIAHGGIGYYAKNVYTANSGESKLFTAADGFVFYDDDTNRYLMGYNGNKVDLVLPDLYNGSPYGIYSGAFFGRFDLNSIVITKRVTSIDNSSFLFCDGLDEIFYEGGKADLEITCTAGDDPGFRAPVVSYYSESQPTESGYYWHYIDGVPTPWEMIDNTPEGEGMQNVAIENADYYLFVPQSWISQKESGISGARVSNDDTSNVIVTVYLPDHPITVDEYWNDFCLPSYQNGVMKDFSLMQDQCGDTVLGGKNAKTYVFIFTLDGKAYEVMQIITEKDSQLYTLTYTAEPSVYEKHFEDIETIRSQFLFK